MAEWYLVPERGGREGPFTEVQLRGLLAQGQLGPGSRVWREGLDGWMEVRDVPELKSVLAESAAQAGSEPVEAATGSAFGGELTPMPATAGDVSPAPVRGRFFVGWAVAGGAVAASCVVFGCVVLVLLNGVRRGHHPVLRDSTMVRAIHQGMVLWAGSNGDRYPVPSEVDRAHATISAADGKDFPRHIISILIYNGYFSPELCVSGSEVNPSIAVNATYVYSTPPGALNPSLAVWDPAFKALPVEARNYGEAATAPGGMSFALRPPVGARGSAWGMTYSATEAIVGNRGPAYARTSMGLWELLPTPVGTLPGNSEIGTGSNTLRIHGGPTTWEGNICYNDNHANFETRPDPETLPFTFTGLPVGNRTRFDNLFVDENDATRQKDGTNGVRGGSPSNTNNLLRNWNSGEFDPETGALISIPAGLWFD